MNKNAQFFLYQCNHCLAYTIFGWTIIFIPFWFFNMRSADILYMYLVSDSLCHVHFLFIFFLVFMLFSIPFFFFICFFLFGNFVGLSLKSSSWTKLCVSHPFVLDFGFFDATVGSDGAFVEVVLLLLFIFRYSKIYEYKFRQARPIGKYHTTHSTSMQYALLDSYIILKSSVRSKVVYVIPYCWATNEKYVKEPNQHINWF